MNMPREEIVRQYQEGKNKKEQIKILADMNLCNKKEIEKILKDNGCEIPSKTSRKKPQNKPEGQQEKPTPEKPQEAPRAAGAKKNHAGSRTR